jgi:hypothetical protein
MSIVSHFESKLAELLLRDIERNCAGTSLEIILTLNVPESLSIAPSQFSFPVRVIRNAAPKGFGENRNAAFHQVDGRYCCVMSPDCG